MSKRHTLVTLILLSSSTAFAKPAKHHRPTLEQRIYKRFHVDRDSDGYPMVGNVKGKVGGGTGDDDEAISEQRSRDLQRDLLAELDPRYITRIFSR